MSHISTVTAATIPGELYTRAQEHLRLDASPDDLLSLRGYVAAAVADFEMVTGRQLFSATKRLNLETWHSVIDLKSAPVASLTSLTYWDKDDAPHTVADSEYETDLDEEPGKVFLDPDFDYPDLSDSKPYPVQTTFVCGYGTDVRDIPPQTLTAILIYAGQLYDDRTAEGTANLQHVRDVLFAPYKLNFFGIQQ